MNDPLVDVLPKVVLKGEYAVVSGDKGSIATPNADNGAVMVITDPKSGVVALAHFEQGSDFTEVTGDILRRMLESGTDFNNLECTLMGRKIPQELRHLLEEKGIHYDTQKWTGEHAYNVEAKPSGTISTNNSAEEARKMKLAVLLGNQGEERLNEASQSFDRPSTSPSPAKTLRLIETEIANEGVTR